MKSEKVSRKVLKINILEERWHLHVNTVDFNSDDDEIRILLDVRFSLIIKASKEKKLFKNGKSWYIIDKHPIRHHWVTNLENNFSKKQYIVQLVIDLVTAGLCIIEEG